MIKNSEGMPSLTEVEQSILRRISSYCNLKMTDIDPAAPMENIALDSILAMTIVEELQDEFNVDLPTFLFYEHDTIRSTAKFIISLMQTSRA